MQPVKSAEQKAEVRGKASELDNRYGKIGISAVAAAVRYQGEARPERTTLILRSRQE